MKLELDPRIESGVDEWIKKDFEETRRPIIPGEFYVSDLCGFNYDVTGGWCPRQAYYRYKTVEDRYNREKAGFFKRGHAYEMMVAETILPSNGWNIIASGPQRDDDVRHLKWEYKGVKFHGHIDILANHKDDPTVYVFEIKSTNFHSRDVFDRFCQPPDFPKEGNVLQVNAYATQIERPFQLAYISIGDISMRSWRSNFDASMANIPNERGVKLNEYLKSGEIPMGRTSWLCNFQQRTKPRTYCEAFNWCRRMGNYWPHPRFYAYCAAERLTINEFNYKDNISDLMVDPESGCLMCPQCGKRCQRRWMKPGQEEKYGVPVPEFNPLMESGNI
jgi:hypothetical protein